MNIQTEAVHTAEFLLSEGNREISREAITVAAGDALPAGQVLGIQTASGHYAAYSPAATDGTEVAVGILHAALPPRQTYATAWPSCAWLKSPQRV